METEEIRTETVDVKGGQLGTIVSWRVPQEVSYDLLQNALISAGLDPELASELAPAHALRRALREMKQGRVIRKLRREDNLLFFQFTREHLDEREIQYEKEAELSLDVHTGLVSCDVHEIRDEAVRLLKEHQAKRLTADMTRLLHRVYAAYSADLIPIREQGGAYFVPDMHADLVQQTAKFLDRIGGRMRSFAVRLGSADTAEAVAESMSDYLTQMIQEFRASCEGVDGTSRRDTKERRMGSIAEMRRKLELYRGLLAGYAEHITESINAAEEELLRKLAQGEETREAA